MHSVEYCKENAGMCVFKGVALIVVAIILLILGGLAFADIANVASDTSKAKNGLVGAAAVVGAVLLFLMGGNKLNASRKAKNLTLLEKSE